MNNARNAPSGDLRLRRGVEHLGACGIRPTAEFMLAFARAHDAEDDLLARLDLWRAQLAPELVKAIGADRFPPLMQVVTS